MQYNNYIESKIHTADSFLQVKKLLKFQGKKIVFTNGCFDLLHIGHLHSLHTAASLGDYLVVAINSDNSVKKQKGESRPIQDEQSRANILANLLVVNAVIIFDAETPLELIQKILPDVLVKGSDYSLDTIVGAKEVIANGGKVEIISLKEGFSTTNTINKLQK